MATEEENMAKDQKKLDGAKSFQRNSIIAKMTLCPWSCWGCCWSCCCFCCSFCRMYLITYFCGARSAPLELRHKYMQQKQQQKQQQFQQPQQLQGNFGNSFEKVWPHLAWPHLTFSKRYGQTVGSLSELLGWGPARYTTTPDKINFDAPWTYAEVRRRTWTYVDVRGRTWMNVDVRRRTWTYVDLRGRTSTYVHVYVDVRRRTSTYVDVP